MIGIEFVVTLTVIVLVLWLIWYRITKPWRHLPTPKYLIPFFGQLFRIPLDTSKLIGAVQQMFNETGSIFVIWITCRPTVVSKDVGLLEEIFKTTQYIRKGTAYDLLKEWLGTGLLLSDGKKWKTRRRMLTPAFHFDILKSNFEIIHRHSKHFAASLKNYRTNDQPIEFFKITKEFSLNVLLESAMGIQRNTAKTNENITSSNYTHAVDRLAALPSSRYSKPWQWNSLLYRLSSDGREYYKQLEIAHQFVRGVIENRISSLNKEDDDKKCRLFLDILLDAYQNKEIDIEGIVEEVNTFMFEGHDTVSSAISWTVYCIGRDKNVQEKVFEEINSIPEEGFCMESLTQLKYTECVIKESLRLHPPVPFVFRHIETDVEINGVTIPANSDIVFHILFMHRDENVWKNATKFKPERFNDDSYNKRNPFTFLPFSAGPRNCIGQRFAMMELKLVLFYLMKNFSFESMQTENELKEHIEVIHRTNNGLWIKCLQRKEKEN